MKKITILLLLLTGLVVAKAQLDPNLEKLRTVVPPSPNASSIAKYGEWPVSLYTGVPGINIPLYELKGRGVSVPVSLSYHASGIRVGEIASWVGLGWSLNAGGVITRSIRGLPDELSYFSSSSNYTNPNNFCSPGVDQTKAANQVCLVANGKADSQMDIYSFSAMGKSYSLIISADGTVYTRPYSNIKITSPFFNAQDYWKVILEDGTVLIFGGRNNYIETTANARFGTDGGGDSYTSAWQLKSITTAYGEVVNFNYSNLNQIDQDTHITQSDFIKYNTSQNVAIHSTGTSSHAERQSVIQSYLSSIESDNTRVEFIANISGRQDLKGGAILSELKIYSKLAGKYIDDYTFNYVYSSSVPGNEYTNDLLNDTSYIHHRLKLSGISHNGDPAYNTLQPQFWTFEYNQTPLPSRRSFAQDHWGFYNGAVNNTSLLPRVFSFSPITPGANYVSQDGFTPNNYHDLGGIKSPDEKTMQAEMLTKIIYPTGGQSQFVYEGNAGYVNREVLADTSVSFHLYTTANQPVFTNSITYNFKVTQQQYANFSINGRISSSITNNFPGAKIYVRLVNLDANATAFEYSGNGTPWINILKTGNYQLVIGSNTTVDEFTTANDYVDISVLFSYLTSHGIQNVKTLYGGLRIKSITDLDNVANISKTKNYLYDAAFVINPIDTLNDYITTQRVTEANTVNYTKVTRNLSTKFSLGSIQGGTVGYGQVMVVTNQSDENGKTIYHFSNEPDAAADNAKVFPYPPTDSRDWRRGLLLDETTYNTSGVPLKKTTNAYSFANKFSATNYAAGFAQIVASSLCVSMTGGVYCCGIVSSCYPVSTEQVLHNSKTETIYDQNGQNPLTATTNYYYDNPNNVLPVRTESYDSKGNLIKTISRTALEKTDISNVFAVTPSFSYAMDTMINRNMINDVLQQEEYSNNNLLKRVTRQQKVWDNNFVQTEKINVQNGNNIPEYRILFNRYDGFGNINEQQKSGDVREVYLWSYHSTYPVAKVVGSDYATVSSVVSTSQIDAAVASDDSLRNLLNLLRTDARTKNALVYTYTYAPLIGMTSETDPAGKTTYYEYDGFERLHIIRDKDHNIIKDFCYGYRGNYAGCPVIYVSTALSKGFQRNNCTTGGTGTTVTYTVAAGTYTSIISQADANQKAINDLNTNGQAYANANGTCASQASTTYYNIVQSGNFVRNNCAAGGTGSTVTYTVAAGTYNSTISQADADQKAINDVNTNGQTYTNANGTCTYPVTTYYNTVQSGVFTRNNCAAGGTGSTVTYTVAAGTYNSTISQADADQKAINDVNTNGQAYANANGICTFYNAVQSGSFTKNNCPNGGTGSTVTYTVAAGTYSSTVSQADADQKATNDVNTNGQAYANNNGTCTAPAMINVTYYNTTIAEINLTLINTVTNLTYSFTLVSNTANLTLAGQVPNGIYNVRMTSNTGAQPYSYGFYTFTASGVPYADFFNVPLCASCAVARVTY